MCGHSSVHKDSRQFAPTARFIQRQGTPFALTFIHSRPNMSNFLSAFPNHSIHSFPLFVRAAPVGQSGILEIIENERKTSIMPENQPLLYFRVDHPSSIPFRSCFFFSSEAVCPSSALRTDRPGSGLYLESDLFSHSPPLPTTTLSRRRRRRPTFNLRRATTTERDRDERTDERRSAA